MEDLRKNGITYAFSELFRPHSMIPQEDHSHCRFMHEAEILDLLEVIDGTKEDENLLGFLDYDKIKEGKMCRHIVMVLPFRASCDSMAALLRREAKRFKNLDEYEIINIAGFDDIKRFKDTNDIKRAIKACEEKGCKTLTLTVNRMLTGTTVPQWDAMIYLKGTASPQEYDQAIFRLQNQYVTTFKNENGRIIKYNMKPQTLLVDFDPNRMFRLQELKSQLYNVNTEAQGNVRLKERIAKELEISPIIVLNKNKLQQATPTNITDAVREYSRNRSIMDDASEIPADNFLLGDTDILKIIQGIAPIDAKNGLQIKPTEGKENDIDSPNDPTEPGKENPEQDGHQQQPDQPQEAEEDNLAKRLAAYYARILFFAFLTESTVKSLEEVVAAIPATKNNLRIAKNLGLDIHVLKTIQLKSNPFILQKFDYKIENTNDLTRDTALQPLERAEIAMRKFGRLSDSEVVTPAKVADEMVAILPFEELDKKEDAKFLDIASKQAEFPIAIYKRFGEGIKSRIYAIPTSTLAYEFTRKVYTLLAMPVKNIFSNFTSYDLIKENNEKIIKQLKDMRFDVIISNPPYHVKDGGAGASASPIYNEFIDVSKKIKSNYISMIIPAKWYSGGKGLETFREKMLNDTSINKIIDFVDSRDCFPSADIAGGICYFLWDKGYKGLCQFTHNSNGKSTTMLKSLNNHDTLLRNPIAENIVAKIKSKSNNFFDTIVSSRKPFGLATNVIVKKEGDLHIRYNQGVGFFYRIDVPIGKEMIDKWKVTISYLSAEHAGQPDKNGQFKILSSLSILPPQYVCTETYLIAFASESKQQSDNALKYFQSKFLRFLVSVLAISQHITKGCFRFVPQQDFAVSSDIDWSKNVPEIDTQLYTKYELSEEEIAFIESKIKPM